MPESDEISKAIEDFKRRLKLHGETKRELCITEAAAACKFTPRSSLARAIREAENLEKAIAYFHKRNAYYGWQKRGLAISEAATAFNINTTVLAQAMQKRSTSVQKKKREAPQKAQPVATVAVATSQSMRGKKRPPSPYEQLRLDLI